MVITQKFNTKHFAWDIVTTDTRKLRYGTPLAAPERVKVIRIVGDTYTPGDTKNLARGYGIFMQGLETGLFHQYWHTLPILPVSVGDIVERGKIVAFMGNAGTVRVGGKDVPVEQRLEDEKPGTHLHWEIMETYTPNKKGKHVDPKTLVDVGKLPTYTSVDVLRSTAVVLGKMSRLLSK
jgi:murein DD-endopeptidase MepM/ murein hydrolase activator NlpD